MKIYATTNSLKPAQSQSRLRHALFMGNSDCVMVNDLTREEKFVIIQIQLSNQGLVQMDKCILEEIHWTTEFFKYTINLTGNREVFQNEESLYIVILPQDIIESVEDKRYNSKKDFFKDVVMHCEYEQHNIFYYAESVWEFFLTIHGFEQIGDSEIEGENQIEKKNKINEGKPNNKGLAYHILYRSDSWHKYRDDDHNIILRMPVVRKEKKQ